MPLTYVFILIAKKNKNVYVLFMLDYPYLLTRYPCWDEYLLKMKQGAKNKKIEIRDSTKKRMTTKYVLIRLFTFKDAVLKLLFAGSELY